MKTKEKEIKKEQQVLGGKFDKKNYVEERVWATAEDGTKIPISMIYRKGMKKMVKIHCCYMPMVLMALLWILIFHLPDYRF